MNKEELLKMVAPVIGYGVVGHSLDFVVETLRELDSDLANELQAISDRIYERFNKAADTIENLEG